MKSNIFKIALLVLLAAAVGDASAESLLNDRRGASPMAGRLGGGGRPGGGNRLTGRLGGRAGAAQQAPAEDGEKSDVDPYNPLKGVDRTNGVPVGASINVKNATTEMLCSMYADVAERVLIMAPNLPKMDVTMTTFAGRDFTKEEYLNTIERYLTVNGVVLERVGDLYLYALDRKTVRTQGIRTSMDPTNSIPENGRVVSQLIRLQNITAKEAQEALEGFKDPNGLFQVFERNNTILVTDTQENVNRMLELVKELDVANPVNEEVFEKEIRFAVASEIKTYLELIRDESQKDQTSPSQTGVKSSGAAGFQRATPPTPSPSRLLLGNRPGQKPPEPQPATPNATMTAGISDADRGMIRGKALIVADDRANKLIIITSPANMKFFDKVIKALDVPTTPDVKVEVVRLKYADAEDVASMLNDLIGNGSSSAAKNNQNQATKTSTASGSKSLTAGGSAQTTSARPRTQGGAALANTLGALNKENIKILADKRINGVVVMARKDDMHAVKDVIEEMDVRLSQVLIETVIVQVELGDDLSTGIDWVQRGRQHVFEKQQIKDKFGRNLFWEETTDDEGNSVMKQTTTDTGVPVTKTVKKLLRDGFVNNGSYGLGGGGGSESGALQSMMQVGTNAAEIAGNSYFGTNPIGGGINYLLKSDKLNIAAVIKASKSDSRTKVLASPILMTVDNKDATIEATDMIYLFSGYQYSGSSMYGSQVRNYEKRDIGLTVKVTPHINPNGTVELEVEQTFETQGADQSVPNEQGGTDPYATVTTRKIQSDVSVENRQTVVMGGLSKKTNKESESGIPILKDIPWIGKWLFGSVVQKEARSELLVFMTPYVLDEAATAQAEALRRKKALSDPRPWEDNGWSLSPVADPVARKEQLRRLNEEWERQDEERRNQKALEEARRRRARKLLEMDEADRREWVESHQKEIREEQERFEGEQKDLRKLIDDIRERSEAAQTVPGSEPGSEAPAAPAPAPAAPAPAAPAPAATPAVPPTPSASGKDAGDK